MCHSSFIILCDLFSSVLILSLQLALKASQLLEQTKLSELRANIARNLSELEMFTEEGERLSTPRRKMAINERMEDLVSAPLAVEDALVALFDHSDYTLLRRVIETYIRRLYQVTTIMGQKYFSLTILLYLCKHLYLEFSVCLGFGHTIASIMSLLICEFPPC